MILRLPVDEEVMLASGRNFSDTVLCRQVVVEIGYYTKNPLKQLVDLYNEKLTSEMNRSRSRLKPGELRSLAGDILGVIAASEGQGNRDERVLFSHDTSLPDCEEVLTMAIEGVAIPVRSTHATDDARRDGLKECRRIEISYEPSMLDYFFPNQGQQAFLCPSETEYLRSQKMLVLNSADQIRALDEHIGATSVRNEIVYESTGTARITCHADEQPASLIAYSQNVIDAKSCRCFRYIYGTPGLREMTPQIQSVELRIGCVNNLKDLWRRLRLYYIASGTKPTPSADSAVVYPSSTDWCDAMVKVYREGRVYPGMTGPHKCPSAGDGRSHYAMNPNCEPESPDDTVLLFETRAGWNQHGGAEQFTFDNHDPKGGCVLLNDGTVKFIRTKEELHALRWK